MHLLADGYSLKEGISIFLLHLLPVLWENRGTQTDKQTNKKNSNLINIDNPSAVDDQYKGN